MRDKGRRGLGIPELRASRLAKMSENERTAESTIRSFTGARIIPDLGKTANGKLPWKKNGPVKNVKKG